MERWHSSTTMKSNSSMGNAGLYSTGTGCLKSVSADSDGQIVEVRRRFLLTLQHGIDALDGTDDDAGGGVEGIAAEALDDLFFGELVAVHRRDELLELLQRLVAEIAAVHEEQDALRPGILHEAVDKIDGGVGLP